jgi:bifunctional non-homologous end joining protein LigD
VPLEEYRKKRDFTATSEPEGSGGKKKPVGKIFVVQEHHASHLHYDLRLERDGVLVSFAVPKGIPEKAGEKHLAVHVEDHPLEYADFEGTIPEGEYGAGQVKIWDRGLYEPLYWKDDKIEIVMKGERLAGRYVLVRFRRAGKDEWLLFRAKD